MNVIHNIKMLNKSLDALTEMNNAIFILMHRKLTLEETEASTEALGRVNIRLCESSNMVDKIRKKVAKVYDGKRLQTMKGGGRNADKLSEQAIKARQVIALCREYCSKVQITDDTSIQESIDMVTTAVDATMAALTPFLDEFSAAAMRVYRSEKAKAGYRTPKRKELHDKVSSRNRSAGQKRRFKEARRLKRLAKRQAEEEKRKAEEAKRLEGGK